nr:uncharacterized protein LOC111425372 isoform X1 [Onthophagus taurus]XP_022915131.1 uncharacterized protein LOC111425372 isoform X1 [Onthophagus taurus]
MTVNSQSGPRSPRPPDDLITTATSALRRLNFKTGRCATKNTTTKTQGQNVPKVVVMGSSTASETTINTSTDSNNTMVTTITATDGEVTEDSLDMNEPIDILNTENVLEGNSTHPILQPITLSPTPPQTGDIQKTPATAKLNTKFNFELDHCVDEKRRESVHYDQIEAIRIDARRRNSYKAAAQGDFDRIEVYQDEERRPSYRFRNGDFDGNPGDSPKSKVCGKKHQSPSHHQKDNNKFNYDETHIARYNEKSRMTPPLPDLRVDFFSESVDGCQEQTLLAPGHSMEKRGSVCLNKCLREVGAQLEANVSTSPINVTTNPLENPVHFGGRKQPQATIVVQQPSLSLDQANVSTILLRNGSEFVSNVESAPSGKLSKKQKEENMKQLLDVAGNLTVEEIHDFEKRYGSPHHNRSQSVKTPGRSSGRPNYLCLPQQRSRVASMPNTGVEEEYYRLRHFSITGKGVVNRGDSLKSRRSRSNNSVASSNSSTEQLPGAVSGVASARTSASCSLASSRESSTSVGPLPYKVLMLGAPAVGKSSLVSQFMTSEFLQAFDTSIDDDSGERSISVLLAGQESELMFVDYATADMSPDSIISKYNDPHAYCVVYSITDRDSLECSERILQTLWTMDAISTKAVILVANKADLVRSRVIPEDEGKAMATSFDCKYIETSTGINHNVNELLVGILTQIRLKLENPEKTRDLFRKRSCSKRNINRNKSPASATGTPSGSAQNSPKKYRGSRTSASLKVKSLLGRVWARDSKSKSCENLHVL